MKRKQCHEIIDQVFQETKKSRFVAKDTQEIKILFKKVSLFLNWKESFKEYVQKHEGWRVTPEKEQKEILRLLEEIKNFDYSRKTNRDNHYDSYGGDEEAKNWFYDLIEFTISFQLLNLNVTAYHHVWYYSSQEGKKNFIDHGSQNHDFGLDLSITTSESSKESKAENESDSEDYENELKGPVEVLQHVKGETFLEWSHLSFIIFGWIHHVVMKNEVSDPFQMRWGKDRNDNWVTDKEDTNLFDWSTEYKEKTIYEYWNATV